MAKSTQKVILFSRVELDGKPAQWPTAVFNDHPSARAYATMVKIAHQSGDVKSAKALDGKTPTDKAGKLVPGIRFSIAEVPYAPTPDLGDDELFGKDEEPTP